MKDEPSTQPKSLWAVMAGEAEHDPAAHTVAAAVRRESTDQQRRGAAPRRSRRAVHALFLGAAALPLAAMSMRPELWFTFPAVVAGVAAIVLGVVALSDVRTSRGRLTGAPLALAGMLLGLAGILLGPTLFSDFGTTRGESVIGRDGKPVPSATGG